MTHPEPKEAEHAPQSSTRRKSRSRRRAGGEDRREDRGGGQGRHTRPRTGRENRGRGRGRHTWTTRSPPPNLVPDHDLLRRRVQTVHSSRGYQLGYQLERNRDPIRPTHMALESRIRPHTTQANQLITRRSRVRIPPPLSADDDGDNAVADGTKSPTRGALALRVATRRSESEAPPSTAPVGHLGTK